MTTNVTFDNEFDLTENDLSEVIIKETHLRDKCLLWDAKTPELSYNSFTSKTGSGLLI